MNKPAGREALTDALLKHHPWDEKESEHLERFIRFVREEPDCFKRSLVKGHITGSAWITNQSNTHVALVFHRKLKRWLQPGGHADGNTDIYDVAYKEAREETGIQQLDSEGYIFDVDIHRIPSNHKEESHFHYDIRFLFRAMDNAPLVVSGESFDVRWVKAADIPDLTGHEASIIRMHEKWLSGKQTKAQRIR